MDEWAERRVEGVRKVFDIFHRYQSNAMTEGDVDFLIEKSKASFFLAEIADRDWAKFQAELMAKNIEIEELKRQLEERQ